MIVTGGEPSMPIPTLMEGARSNLANFEVADHLFLRLANLGPGLVTAGDLGFVPMLARSWSRRDSVTLVFELDPRARWHDGAPVTVSRRGIRLRAGPRPGHRAQARDAHRSTSPRSRRMATTG